MSLFTHIKSILEQNENFVKDGEVFKNKVVEAALKLDPTLLNILLKDEKAKSTFFQEVETVLVFDKMKFQKFISNKEFLPDSFTEFKNKIGLTANREYLTEAKEVVLDFPYKDCVLEGGQTKEDQKRQEIFWNTTLAPDEIDRLFEPKVLTNWKRISVNGNRAVGSFTINDNLIIKGNNLIALHSLLQVYKNKIKLIYIDPPYNTGSDGFNYNDGFTHSTWLTFMKNRLEVAKELLNNDGIIYISIDDREQSYLKVLCDEIFSRENFITSLVWRKKAGGGNDSQDIAVEHEYILAYRKMNNGIYKLPLDDKLLKTYNQTDEKLKTHGPYKTKDLNDPSLSDSPGLHYDIECPDGSILSGKENQWKCNKETFIKRLNDNRIVFKEIKGKWKVHYKIYLNEEKGKLNYDSNGNVIQKGKNLSSILYDVALNKDGSTDIKELFDGEKPFSYPKPVNLLSTLILSATKEDDIILDFFGGSGTTAEAVIKLNSNYNSKRKFIIIEQMDYVESITCKRIEKSFSKYGSNSSAIYCEILECNTLIKDIDFEKSSYHQLKETIEKLNKHSLLKFNVDIDILLSELEKGNVNITKHALKELIDNNNFYINYSDLYNKDFNINDIDKKLCKSFYTQ